MNVTDIFSFLSHWWQNVSMISSQERLIQIHNYDRKEKLEVFWGMAMSESCKRNEDSHSYIKLFHLQPFTTSRHIIMRVFVHAQRDKSMIKNTECFPPVAIKCILPAQSSELHHQNTKQPLLTVPSWRLDVLWIVYIMYLHNLSAIVSLRYERYSMWVGVCIM